MEWFKKVVPTIGLLIGIIFVAIGGVMTIGSTLKYFFIEPDLSYVQDFCMNSKLDSVVENNSEISMEEEQMCIDRRIVQERVNQKNNFKRNLIDGFSFLLVGLVFWILWDRKQK